MEGVTVINTTYEEITSNTWNWNMAAIVIGICWIMAVFLIVYGFSQKNSNTKLFGFLFACIFMFAFFGAGHSNHVIAEVPVYEVVCSEDVRLLDFYKKYDVIEVRGDSFVVKDKTDIE